VYCAAVVGDELSAKRRILFLSCFCLFFGFFCCCRLEVLLLATLCDGYVVPWLWKSAACKSEQKRQAYVAAPVADVTQPQRSA
jgi:hypothetical protein